MADPVRMWAETALGKAVKEHIDNGLKVFPLHGIDDEGKCTCGSSPCGKNNNNAGKHPYTKHGLLDATGDFEVAAEMFDYRINLNVGVATGKASGIVVLDIDNKNNNAGSESIAKVQELLGLLPKTMRLATGNGYHLIFDYPESGLKTNTNSYGKDFPGIDVRADGGYIVIYPSRHYSGRNYEPDPECSSIADLPPLHLDFLKRDKTVEKKPFEEPVFVLDNQEGDWSEEDVREMLTFISADCLYDDWYRIGMALQNGGYAWQLFDDWSASAPHRYPKGGKGDIYEKWRTFKKDGGISMGTLVDKAMAGGWRPPMRDRGIDLEIASKTIAPLLKKIKEKHEGGNVQSVEVPAVSMPMIPPSPMLVKNAPPVVTPQKFPNQFCFDPMGLPGGIGDTVRFIVSTSIYEQPELALMNVIGFAGAVFGRKYASPIDTRTNVYMVGIADTGCHAKGAKIMMADGSLKKVEDVDVDEAVMGPDSYPRYVRRVIRGKQKMYKIIPNKGEAFVVNENHILSLRNTSTRQIVNISVKEYIKKDCQFKHLHKIWRTGINFQRGNVLSIDPWFLGALLGDGYFVQCITLTSADKEIADAACSYAESIGISPRIRRITQKNKALCYRFAHANGNIENYLRNELRKLGLYGKTAKDKFVPHSYKVASRSARLEVLAGLLDTDGSLSGGGYDFISKSKTLAMDVVFLCRSLGLAAYLKKTKKKCQNGFCAFYYRVSISGDCDIIPLRCSRKRAPIRKQKKSVLVTGFSIEPQSVSNFYGFTLSGDHLYLTGDFTVHHNSGKEHSVRLIERIALNAGLMNHVGANSIRSDIGLLKALMKNSSLLMNIDEFGMLMQALTDHRAPYHFRSIVSIITKLYSKSSGVYKHGEVADERQKELIIASPNLCLFGTTTEESYIPALKKSAINSGELNRYIVIPSRQKPMPKRTIPTIEYPPDLIAWWNQFAPTSRSSLGALVNSATIMPTVKTVAWGECEEMQYGVMCEQSNIRNSNTTTKGLWTRLYENAVKIAMVFAIARDPENPSMIKTDMEWAYSIVDASIKYMNTLATEHMVENAQEDIHLKVLRAIKETGDNGLSQTDLLRRFRTHKKRDLEELTATYVAEEEIVIGRIIPKSGRPKQVYYAIDTDRAKALLKEDDRMRSAAATVSGQPAT